MSLSSKRNFVELDEAIAPEVWSRFPAQCAQIRRIQELERVLQSTHQRRQRRDVAMSCEPRCAEKAMRVFVKHAYSPGGTAPHQKGSYELTIEGVILDEAYIEHVHFGAFFDKIRIQTEKRANIPQQVFEWTAKEAPEGCTADVFKVKLAFDKPCMLKIFLHKSPEVVQRYDTTPELRQLLVGLRPDPSLPEVVAAVHQYIATHNLDERGRVSFRCDKLLSSVFDGAETCLLTDMTRKLEVR